MKNLILFVVIFCWASLKNSYSQWSNTPQGVYLEDRKPVGIGINFPQAILHIYSPSRVNVNATNLFSGSLSISEKIDNTHIRSLGIDGNEIQAKQAMASSFPRFTSQPSSPTSLHLQRFGGDLIIQRDNTYGGNVGIGIGSPESKLHVDGDIRANSFIGDGSQLTGINLWSNSSSTSGIFFNLGNVAIGPDCFDNNTARLTVDGQIIAEDIIVQMSDDNGCFPDYVFDEQYQLLSLEELETFIEDNHHLPNVPSAKEVEENGQKVGAMQRVLLEKIEEQALYILQLKKENDNLENRLKKLEEVVLKKVEIKSK